MRHPTAVLVQQPKHKGIEDTAVAIAVDAVNVDGREREKETTPTTMHD